jgi:hypothetical protein
MKIDWIEPMVVLFYWKARHVNEKDIQEKKNSPIIKRIIH